MRERKKVVSIDAPLEGTLQFFNSEMNDNP